MPSLCRLVPGLAIAAVALAVAPASAQPDAVWSASGEVEMRYREGGSGAISGRTTAEIPETVETDVILGLEIGGLSGPSDDDPGTLSISHIGDDETPRDLGDVDVNVGMLTLNDSVVDGSISVGGPSSEMVVQLSDTTAAQLTVAAGGLFSAQTSAIAAVVREGGIARISGCIGSVGSTIGADIEIDSSILGSANFQGKQVVTNSSYTGGTGSLRQGDFDLEAVSVDVSGDLRVGGNTTGAVPTDTVLLMTSSVFESGTAQISSGLSSGVVIDTDFEMRGASVWRSFGLFTILNQTTHVEINSGSRIDARADFRIASAFATIGSGTQTSSRIDVAGDFDLDGSLPSALTIEDGGYVDVDGTFTIGEFGTLNLNGGTLRVGAFVNDAGGTFNENGGTLIVPEASGAAPLVAAASALAWLRRRRH
jgi:hypothetical protein